MTSANLHQVQSNSAGEPDAALAIATHLAKTRYEDLPASVVQAAKASILDTLGCILAGTPCDDVLSVRKVAAGWAGAPSSTVIGSGGMRLPAASAVLGNGAAIHQFDYDDTHDIAVMHPTSASLTPALALSEAQGGALDKKAGQAIITAVALGNDISSRVGLATRGRMWDHPWFRAPVIGLFGATAASAKIMGATAQQHVHALGLTLPQTYRFVLLPMAFRIVLPPLTSEWMNIIKNSSVAFAVSISELTLFAMQAQEETSRGIEIYLAVTAAYMVSALVVNRFMVFIEKRLRVPGYVGGER